MMNSKCILVNLLFFVLLNSAAQKQMSVDSLLQITTATESLPNDRFNAYDALVWDVYLYYKPDSAVYFSRKWTDFALKLGDTIQLTNAIMAEGIAHRKTGNYAAALKRLEECSAIYRIMESSSDSLTNLKGMGGQAAVRGNMGNIYRSMGDHEQALKCYDFSKEMTEKIKKRLGPKAGKKQTLSIANSLINSGATYIYQKKWEAAKKANSDALALFVEINDVDAQASCFRNLGMIAEFQNDYPLALSYYEKCMEIRKHESDATERASIFNSMAIIYFKLGDYKLSAEWNHRSYKLAKEINGQVAIRDAAEGLYHAYRAMDVSDSAGYFLREAIRINDGLLINNFPILSEKEKEMLFEMVLPEYASLYSYALYRKEKEPAVTAEVYSTIVRNKGMLLRSSASLIRLIKTSGDTALVRLYDQWIAEREMVAKGFNDNQDTKTAEEKANATEREMVKRSSAIGVLQAEKNVHWSTIQASLKRNEAAIEFVAFLDKYHDLTIPRYAALVIRPGMKQPEMIPLCDAKQIESQIRNSSATSLSAVQLVYGTLQKRNSKLYALIWKPLDAVLKGVTRVYYAPDGLLHKISFAALSDDQGNYLSDNYQLYPVSNTAVLAQRKDAGIKLSEIHLYGGVEYAYGNAPKVWEYLPGTRLETDKISELLQRKGIVTEYYFGNEGTELRFRDRSSAGLVLHVSTHGFFFPDPQSAQEPESKEVQTEVSFRGTSTEGRNRFVINPNPMMRSGLVFAGANRVWAQDEETEADQDGVLTALEISTLDLSKVQLVVMSACETGLGDVRGSEGVFGLQRSLKMSGVRYIMMSLWQVPDKETAEFMLLFYSALLKSKDVRQSFESAQKVMRKKYDPFFWAAFVLVE
ncbi:MAG: CHAT domain-containing protein [Flavobacteriales bacterium]